jgi:hypothetical protein
MPQYNYHHHHVAIIELGHLLTLSALIHPEVSSMVFPGSFCLLGPICYYPALSVTRHSICMLYPISLLVPYFVQNCGYTEFLCSLCSCFMICPTPI